MIKYYRLKDEYALRGFKDKSRMLVKLGDYYCNELDLNSFIFFAKLNGVFPFDTNKIDEVEKKALASLLNTNVIEELDSPKPLSKKQEYKYYDNERRCYVQWSITGLCNLNCLHCFQKTSDGVSHAHNFTLDEAKKVVKELVDYGVEAVAITGGEALVNDNFYKIIKLIIDNGLNIISLNSNGLLLTESVLDFFIEQGLKPRIEISFDGIGTHDWMRNKKGIEEITLNAIKLSISKGFKTKVLINLNKKTLPRFMESMHLLYDMGVRNIFVLRTTEAPKWVEYISKNGNLSLSLIEYFEVIVSIVKEFIKEIRSGLFINFFGIINISPYSTRNSICGNYQKPANTKIAWCTKSTNTLIITSEGYVLPCDGMEGGVNDLGLLKNDINLLTNSLSDIMNKSFFSKVANVTQQDIINNNPECQSCEYLESCRGGVCRSNTAVYARNINNEFNPKDLMGKDETNCMFIKKGYREKIAQILDEYPIPNTSNQS